MKPYQSRILALAARHGRIGYVLLIDGKPKDWSLSCKGSKSPQNAATFADDWITMFDPDVVIIEDPSTAVRKNEKTKLLLAEMITVAEKSPSLVATPSRVQRFANKHLEACAWVTEFPQLHDKLPAKRRLWDPESRNLIYFEALALAQEAGFIPFPDEQDQVG